MNVYDFSVMDMNGEERSMREKAGKVLLIVNTATECGFTPQYDELQDLYEKYEAQGLEILDFPCNQFGNQAPGSNAEIASFCDSKFGITFEQYSKIDVNGDDAAMLFKFLKHEKTFEGFDPEHPLTAIVESLLERTYPDYKETSDIKWNFTKFVIDRKGNVIARFEPTADMKKVEDCIKALL